MAFQSHSTGTGKGISKLKRWVACNLCYIQIVISATTLRVSRHGDISSLRDCILASPQACHCLQLSIEVQSRLAIKVTRSTTSNTLLVSSEAEHWQRDSAEKISKSLHRDVDWQGRILRNGHIDTNLTSFNILLECSRCCS